MKVKGRCLHSETVINSDNVIPNRRPLLPELRNEAVRSIAAAGNTLNEQHKKILSDMTTAELLAGNTTQCQTPNIYKQAIHELYNEVWYVRPQC